MNKYLRTAFTLAVLFLASRVAIAAPLTGYVVHFDCFENAEEGRNLVRLAKRAGAQVINLVPPAHVWDRPDALALLDEVVDEISERKLKFVITRVDASLPPDRNGVRVNYLYQTILNKRGVMPDGSPTVEWFCATVGVPSYDRWMEDETRFYAKRYGSFKNLIGFNLGPFSEPFVSQRGGFLQYSSATLHYELTQNTPELQALLNKPSFSRDEAVSAINEWFVQRYERCRKIWHDEADRKDIPFILQFSGYDDEKFELGYPAYAGFNRKDWISRADAVGLSIYTNGGYKDFGRGSVISLINKLKNEWNFGKSVFVLEGGFENPAPVLDNDALTFFATAASSLRPVTVIYEFLKTPFYVPEEPDSGRLLTADGVWRKQAYKFMKKLMGDVRKTQK